MVFRSIVTQLAKDNEKFIYGCVKEGARAREFEEAIEWLVSAGMVLRIYNVSKPEHPLKAFEQQGHFRFMFDVGLLKHMAAISNEAILLKADYQFKGALTENFVLQQIKDLYDTEPKWLLRRHQQVRLILSFRRYEYHSDRSQGREKAITAPSFKDYLKSICPTRQYVFQSWGLRTTIVLQSSALSCREDE